MICERDAGYFERNKERMRYADFRKKGHFVGSGVLGFWGFGGRMPNRRGATPETIGHAPDNQGCEQHYCLALQHSEQPLGRFLERCAAA
jgi:hypothetical protein